MKLGDAIKKYRMDHLISQRKFAQACGLSNAYISKIEDNTVKSSIVSFARIAAGMGLTVDQLAAIVPDERVIMDPEDDGSINFTTYDTVLPLTAHEEHVITAYRSNPDMQPAVDRILGVADYIKQVKK